MNYTRITFKQHEPTAQNAPQAAQDKPQADPCKDTGDGLLRNTSDSDTVGGARFKAPLFWNLVNTIFWKKVLRPLLAYYQTKRSNQKTNSSIRHMKGTK